MANTKLIHKNCDLLTTTLIDSGANTTFLPLILAKTLDLDLSANETTTVGANGSFKSITSLLGHCQLIENRESSYHDFTNLTVHIPQNNNFQFMILGRDGIFEEFKIRFDERANRINLQRYGK